MRQLTEEEKLATVMVYTNDMLARGEVIAKENARVSIWLRTQGVPNYIHLHKPQVISFAGGTPKTFAFSEIFIPTVQVAAFHLAPPAREVLDYDASEQNRMMQSMDVMVGPFVLKGKIRISMQTDVATSLDVMRTLWLSIYDAEIANPHLPQFNIQVPMLLVNSNYVTLGIT
ncbi:hypothetical protein ANAEL_00622 [Anaerolineales bacterium]|nr:hypothetical protein ANAEL_00622 [Anaerolineales bacterium]